MNFLLKEDDFSNFYGTVGNTYASTLNDDYVEWENGDLNNFMNFEDFDYVDSDKFSGKIILTSFPGLNKDGKFDEEYFLLQLIILEATVNLIINELNILKVNSFEIGHLDLK